MLMLANKINNSNNIPVVVFVIFILCELGVLDFTFSVTTHTHWLAALFRDYPGEPVPER